MQTEIETYFDRLWPITRSLTGEGNRKSLAILSELVDLKVDEIPSGTACFDWNVPPEWNVREAWVKDESGRKIIDMKVNNLHLMGYSEPFKGKVSYKELKEHLFSLPEQPNLIPYITSYYQRRWGFCITHEQLQRLDSSGTFEVFIDSSLDDLGSMSVAEAVLEGSSKKEILISTYICHPSMANNELSGPLVSAFLYGHLKNMKKRRFTYRFIFIPETIGSIYYLSKLGEHWKQNLHAGFVLTCLGDAGKFTYKKSRRGDAIVDRTTETVLKQSGEDFNVLDFIPRGSDERQYCSPGFNLPVGSLMRTMHGQYPEYHTSGDNKDIISFKALAGSVERYLDVIHVLEHNKRFKSTMPYCEPQLGKRGLYSTLGNHKMATNFVDTMMWVLNLADGEHDLIDMSERSGIDIKDIISVSQVLVEKKLIE